MHDFQGNIDNGFDIKKNILQKIYKNNLFIRLLYHDFDKGTCLVWPQKSTMKMVIVFTLLLTSSSFNIYADRRIYVKILGWTTIYAFSSTDENETSVQSKLIL